MVNKSRKYIVISIINVFILTTLLALWTDRFELLFREFVRPIQFSKILGFNVLAFASTYIILAYLRRKSESSVAFEIKIAVLVTLLFSAFLYIEYCPRVYRNFIVNRQIRNQVVEKIEPVYEMANGFRAENLTFQEYQLKTQNIWFPEILRSASNIQFKYSYDGFLPDYSFDLEYEVKEINEQREDISRSQTFVTINNLKRVTYLEYSY